LQRILSDRKYEFDVEFTLRSDDSVSHGFGIILTDNEPQFPIDFHSEFGYRRDFKGLGVFLYKDAKKNGGWVSKTFLK
jgi:hypothetical protein